ncbi:MAG: riboflavin synthase [Gemmatimonadota bacterium]|nr:riboflavin synthase [Gemmatimonadota bacterium]
MFTGLIDEIGTIDRIAETEAGREFRIRCGYESVVAGESIAVNGACLTARETGDGWFTVAAVVTTLGRTAAGDWTVGKRVNLERAMRLGDRLGGHLVQGHVDEVGTVRSTRTEGDALLVDIEVSAESFQGLVPLGSVAVEGVSLTVNALPQERVLQISLIEFTLRHTTLGDLRALSRVHIENDMIGKYVRRLVSPYTETVDA